MYLNEPELKWISMSVRQTIMSHGYLEITLTVSENYNFQITKVRYIFSKLGQFSKLHLNTFAWQTKAVCDLIHGMASNFYWRCLKVKELNSVVRYFHFSLIQSGWLCAKVNLLAVFTCYCLLNLCNHKELIHCGRLVSIWLNNLSPF